MTIPIACFFALLQQGVYLGATSPSSGDTTGYWQQRVSYTIVATLDEAQARIRAHGVLTYVNNSPDTLREMFFHQYLNAFRPGSKWSDADVREYRLRFQDLAEPDYGFERFTGTPLVGGTPVRVDYPGAPDSTVAHFRLPSPLRPGDSVQIVFDWEARPSTVTRRQGRRGRTYDFAQWFPKVAVYDRAGWEPNPLVPAGELYGEFGTYDVTLVVKDDQVLAATGVPVSGDPGWARVSRTGAPYLASNAYGALPPPPEATVPPGSRAVRWLAKDVHHFAWSASPDYIYEGTVAVRPPANRRYQTWDTVGINVLYKPGDDTTWGRRIAVNRTVFALEWLEGIWGPYAYPQITNVHRLDPGGTEFPMMIMDGSASQGLILHEFGHVFTYGILANNEWRSGWMDEGLTDYQTDWAQKLTPQERSVAAPPRLAEGYRVNAVTIPRADSTTIDDWRLEVLDRAEPIGTMAAGFNEFGIYNAMIYNRAKLMYSHLRDAMGDEKFAAFMHDYYSRWALRHVDERAMRASAERAYGGSLAWFFDEWVHGTGLLDYALGRVTVTSEGGRWTTRAEVTRRGELRHPMPVGVKTERGWTMGRALWVPDEQTVEIVTDAPPLDVQLDPHEVTWDWDLRNNTHSGQLGTIPAPRIVFNWPALDQADRRRTVLALSPATWYSNPQGMMIGVRARTNYLSSVDRHDGGFAIATRSPFDSLGERLNPMSRVQFWARARNIYLPRMERPLIGYSGAVAFLDGIVKLDAARDWDLSPFIIAKGPTINATAYATGAYPSQPTLLPEQWSVANVTEIGGSGTVVSPQSADSMSARIHATMGVGLASAASDSPTEPTRGYFRGELMASTTQPLAVNQRVANIRLYVGATKNAPLQRAVYASSADPFATFTDDGFRSRGAALKQDGINFLPLGGAGLRGFDRYLALNRVVSGSVDLSEKLYESKETWLKGSLWLGAFGDLGIASSLTTPLPDPLLVDAGVGFGARGVFYDRPFNLRLDVPFFVNHSGLAGWKGLGGGGSVAMRWVLSVEP